MSYSIHHKQDLLPYNQNYSELKEVGCYPIRQLENEGLSTAPWCFSTARSNSFASDRFPDNYPRPQYPNQTFKCDDHHPHHHPHNLGPGGLPPAPRS